MPMRGSREPTWNAVEEAVGAVGTSFVEDRHDRQRRRELDPADFDRLADAGFLLTAVPRESGGLFESAERSVRPVAGLLRTLGAADASVALVASMHATVPFVCGWLSDLEPPADLEEAWHEQCRFVARTALEGGWWGTITSEPGTGGDTRKTRTRAVRSAAGGYRLTGTKHFGSGSGVLSYMMTTALPDGEAEPDVFYLDLRDRAWDGRDGVTLASEWDGHGMTATQSHGFRFDGVEATRVAWPGVLAREPVRASSYVSTLYASVIVGVVDAAMTAAGERLRQRAPTLGAFERVEWMRAHNEAWLVSRAFEGMIASVEAGSGDAGAITGKIVLGELSESVLTRLCRVLGGGTYARHSPFGFWSQDVRALGYLRPPWALAFRSLEEHLLPGEHGTLET
jgi:alkylation response protein AidB-like acyl-CoA dehydrogenase